MSIAGRRLIVNADDFGLSPGVNRGIIQAHEQGIVTSTSLMTRYPAARAAADYARAHPAFSVGLHIDLCEWIFRDEQWQPLYQVVDTRDEPAVREEVGRQIQTFRDIVGRDPDHLDAHQHVHRDEPVRSVVTRFADELGVPVRHFDPRIVYCGKFYGQGGKGEPYPQFISVEALVQVIRDLPPGVTELCCHPGAGRDLDSVYLHERAMEVSALCDPRVRQALADSGVQLISFADLRT